MAFDSAYWKANYKDPQSMDGIANAHLHARYLQSLLSLEGVSIESLADFGFGLGYLFEKMIKVFHPKTAFGLEPSSYAYLQVKKKPFFSDNPQIHLSKIGLPEWCQGKAGPVSSFDLGICTSVFQYLSEEELTQVIPVISKRVKYLYLTVPTARELDLQIQDFQFFDKYALRRDKVFYRRLLTPHFTFVSGRLLESKFYFKWPHTKFTEHLFRF